jgi:hypothetical protein
MRLKHIREKINEQAPIRLDPQTVANFTRLVRRGLMPVKDLPALKLAMIRHAKVRAQGGDIARLPKQQRLILQKYNDSIQGAALGTTASVMATARNIRNSYEVEFADCISESLSSDPPVMIVLKRKGIRIFPDGRRVALYVNEKLGLTITIPYNVSSSKGGEVIVGVTEESNAEEIDSVFENIEHIKDIVNKKQAKKLKFLDGTKLDVDHQTAHAIHLVHNALNDENKSKVAKMLSHSKGQFMKVADFALKNTAYKINK